MKFWRTFQGWTWENRLLFTVTVIAVLPLLLSLWPRMETAPSSSPSVDTYIPRGFVLIPIELTNYEALDSILGQFAYVDLYSSADTGSKSELVARHVRLLRAPQNPSRFAVLVPESQSEKILAHGGGLSAVVRTPHSGGTEFVNPMAKPRRTIIYEGGRG